jgi:hypothetical protein
VADDRTADQIVADIANWAKIAPAVRLRVTSLNSKDISTSSQQ